MNDLIMMLTRYIVFLLLCTVIFVLAHLPIRLMRYKIDERFLHCRTIAGFAILILISGNRITLPFIIRGLDWVVSKSALTMFFDRFMPQRNYELIYMILIILLMNIGMLICADLVAGIIRLIFKNNEYVGTQDMSYVERILHFPWVLADALYSEVEGGNRREVSRRGCVWHHWAASMKKAFVVMGVLEIAALSVVVIAGSNELAETLRNITMGWYMLPVAGYIMFEQLEYFLGYQMDPSVMSLQSDDIDMELKGHLKELFKVYKLYFSDSGVLLSGYEPHNISDINNRIEYNGITNAQQDACQKQHVLMIISNQLKEAGVRTNQNYNNVLVELLNDSSVSVRDYLQGEILVYLCAYMNYYSAEGETFLILCMDRKRAEEIRECVNACMKRISRVTNLWNIGGLDEADNNEAIHVLVIGFQDLVNHRLLSKRKDFFRNLRTVVIDSAVTFSAYSNIHKEMIFSELSRISREFHRDYQYVLISEVESPTLEASFGSYIAKDIAPFKNVGNRLDAYVMTWAEEGCYRVQRRLGIGGELSEYIGVSMTLALIAVKMQFPSIHIYAGGNKPLQTYRKAMNANMKEIRRYMRRDSDYMQWIRVNDYSDILDKDNLDMIILYDDHFNLYHTLWNWTKYGGKKETLIHIVSPPYLLRDYFVWNIEEQIHRDNDYAPLIGWRTGLDHSRFQAMLLQMANAGMLEKEVMERKVEYGWDYKGIGDLLEAALNSVLQGRRKAYNIYESFSFSENVVFNAAEDKYETQATIRLTDETIRKELLRQTSFVQLNHKTSEFMEEIPILKENLTNYYLRDQVVSIKGILRNIINMEDGILYTENISSDSHKTYYQVSEFEIGNKRIVDHCVDLDVLDFNVYVIEKAKRIIKGYWSSDIGIDLSGNAGMKLSKVYDRHRSDKSDLVTEKHNIQMLEIRIPRRAAEGKAEEMILLLAFMMKELFKTLFPDSYMNLFVITEYEASEDYWNRLFANTADASIEEKIHSIVPFIRPSNEYVEKRSKDDGKPMEKDGDSLSIYIIEYSSVELGMISSIYLNRGRIFRIIHNYLTWYIGQYLNSEAGQKGGFLHLGLEKTPDFFAINELSRFCSSILPQLEELGDAEIPKIGTDAGTICSFCGNPTVYWQDLSDGRHMCSECETQMIKQEDEIRQLFEAVIKNMNTHYGIKIPDKIHLRFASADAIRKKMGVGGQNERILGFCEKKDKGKKKDLWIEGRGPRNTVQSTLIRELTHYWQFEEIGLDKLAKMSPDKGLTISEGHALYVEVCAMRDFGEVDYADAMEAQLEQRDDIIGEGFRQFREYMQTVEGAGSYMNPFEAFRNLAEGKPKDGGGYK